MERTASVLTREQSRATNIYKVRARKDSGKEGFLVVFNYVDEKNYCWLNIGGWDNTRSAIQQTADGGRSELATAPVKIEQGKWYDVELKVVGDSIFASLDGKQIFATKLKSNVKPGVFSTATLDENTGEVILKIANTSNENTTARVCLKGKNITEGRIIRLSSKYGTDENTIDNPTNVYPVESFVTTSGNGVEVEIPSTSLNILRLK